MENRYLKLKADTPLPCGKCGRPVFDVVAFPMLQREGEARSWHITPLCDECLHETTRKREGQAEDAGGRLG